MAKFEIDGDLVRFLSRLLEETGLMEIEYEAEGKRIRVSRNGCLGAAAAPPSPAAVSAGPETAPKPEAADHPGAVVSPMVGTVYTAPEPGAPPFVRIGDEIHEGQTILIVEAMKTMNPLPAPRSGRVRQILIENGDPVEFGEVLMIIE